MKIDLKEAQAMREAGATYDAIAARFDCSPAAVWHRLKRARDPAFDEKVRARNRARGIKVQKEARAWRRHQADAEQADAASQAAAAAAAAAVAAKRGDGA